MFLYPCEARCCRPAGRVPRARGDLILAGLAQGACLSEGAGWEGGTRKVFHIPQLGRGTPMSTDICRVESSITASRLSIITPENQPPFRPSTPRPNPHLNVFAFAPPSQQGALKNPRRTALLLLGHRRCNEKVRCMDVRHQREALKSLARASVGPGYNVALY